MFVCNLCNKKYATKYYQLLHKKMIHDEMSKKDADKEILTCKKCGNYIKTYHEYVKHLKTHNSKNNILLCEYEGCNKSYKKITLFMKHINIVHKKMTEDESYFDLRICKVCDRMFKQPSGLQKHLNNHTDEDKNKYKKIEKVYKISKFNNEQSDFIHSDIENICLVGVPGSGKSTSVAEYLSLKIKKNKLKLNEFVILTFTNSVKNSFIERSKYYIRTNQHKKNIFTKKNIRTLHSLAGSILSNIFGINSTINTVIVAAIHKMKKVIDPEELQLQQPFDALKVILVDESQDMSETQYTFVITLAKILNIKVILAGDPNQSIFQFQGGSCEYMIDFMKKDNTKVVKLVTNYRSTPPIIDFINSLKPLKNTVDMKPYINPERKEEKQKLPYIFIGTDAQIYKNLMDNINLDIKTENLNLEEVAIIGPVKLSKNGSVGLQVVVNLCNKYKIPYVRHYCDGVSNIPIKHNVEKGKLNILTGHKSKGMEFKKVYVLNFNLKLQNRKPDLKTYNELKYLIYVMISRVKNDMIIYSKNSLIWPEIFKTSRDLYQTNKLIEVKDYELDLEKTPNENMEIIKFIENISAEEEYEVLQLIDFDKLETERIYNPIDVDQLVVDKIFIPMFTEIVIKNLMEIFYYNSLKSTVLNFEVLATNTVNIKKKYIYIYKSIQRKLNIRDGLISIEDMKKNTDLFNEKELGLVNYVLQNINNKNLKHVYIVPESDLIFDNKELIAELVVELDQKENEAIIKNIDKIKGEDTKKYNKKLKKVLMILIKILFYKYQTDHQHGALWKPEIFDEILNYIFPLIKNLSMFSKNIKQKYNDIKFQKKVVFNNININGIVDCYNDKFIANIIFAEDSKEFKYKMQVILQHGTINPNYRKDLDHYIWNVQNGEIVKVKFQIKNNWKFYKIISKISQLKLIKMVFCYDLETTGLDTDNDSIIERYVRELNTDSIASLGCINGSYISKKIIKLTGITQFMVDEGDNLKKFVNEIKEISNTCIKPIFIAHNGNRFDKLFLDRILKRKIINKIIFLDSIPVLRVFCNKKLKNYKLETIYKHLIDEKKVQEHRAEGDVLMLIDIFKQLEIDYDILTDENI